MVPHEAVIVWRLRGLVEDVRCYFLDQGARYRLVVERAGEELLVEDHATLRVMTHRAAELRASLIGVGFEPLLVAPAAGIPLDSLLDQFVRIGTAPAPATAAHLR